MIKINLKPDAISQVANIQGEADIVDSDIQRKGLVNILVISILPAAMFVYTSQVRPQKEREIQSLNSTIAELTAFNEKQASIVKEIETIEANEKDVEKKIDAITKLTQGRLAEIKVLDLLQTIIRDKMWLKLIEVDTSGQEFDNSKLLIEGVAQSDLDISIFLEDLSKNILFKDVRHVESEQEQYEGQNYVRFKIAARLEKSK
jgi:type IV pilus assembly protein PilN